MAAKSLVLVTYPSANGGIGFELVAQLAAKGSYHVLLGSRSAEKGNAALRDLQSRNLPGLINMVQIDYQSDDSIKAAAKAVENDHGYLDVLVNNAALSGWDLEIRDCFRQVFDTNVAGPALTVEAFTPLLKKSQSPLKRVINVSSGMGSIATRLDKNGASYNMGDITVVPYRSSKAALSMVTANQSVQLEPHGIKVLAYCPGFTVSNLSHMNKVEYGAKPTSEGVTPLVDLIEGKRDSEEGLFKTIGGVYPW